MNKNKNEEGGILERAKQIFKKIMTAIEPKPRESIEDFYRLEFRNPKGSNQTRDRKYPDVQ